MCEQKDKIYRISIPYIIEKLMLLLWYYFKSLFTTNILFNKLLLCLFYHKLYWTVSLWFSSTNPIKPISCAYKRPQNSHQIRRTCARNGKPFPPVWPHLYGIIYGCRRLSSVVPPCVQNAVIAALSSKSWDVETATELLLSNWNPGSDLPSSGFTRVSATVWAVLQPRRCYRLDSSSKLSHHPVACLTPSAFNTRSFLPPGSPVQGVPVLHLSSVLL